MGQKGDWDDFPGEILKCKGFGVHIACWDGKGLNGRGLGWKV